MLVFPGMGNSKEQIWDTIINLIWAYQFEVALRHPNGDMGSLLDTCVIRILNQDMN